MASMTVQSLDGLSFYVIAGSWFRKAWPLLMTRSDVNIPEDWREQIGRVQNQELISVEHAISSSDEEDSSNVPTGQRQKKRFERLHRKMARSQQKSVMRSGMVHMEDYFLLGPSAWMLVKEKFGFDGIELARPCVLWGPHRLHLAIRLEEGESERKAILIPDTGRFQYERVLSNGATNSSDIVPEEEEVDDSVRFFLLLMTPLRETQKKSNYFLAA